MRAAWRAASFSTTLLALCAAAAAAGAAAPATASSDVSQQRWTVAARHLVTHAQRLGAAAACRPWTVPPQQRCEYVRQHCGDLAGNLLDFLELHFCELGDRLVPCIWAVCIRRRLVHHYQLQPGSRHQHCAGAGTPGTCMQLLLYTTLPGS